MEDAAAEGDARASGVGGATDWAAQADRFERRIERFIRAQPAASDAARPALGQRARSMWGLRMSPPATSDANAARPALRPRPSLWNMFSPPRGADADAAEEDALFTYDEVT